MTQPLPPNQAKRQKNKSMMAIVLAVLLHVLIAIILYVAIFNDTPSSTLGSSPFNEQRPISAIATTAEDQPTSSNTLIEPDASKDIAISSAETPNNKKVPDNSDSLVTKNAAIDKKQKSTNDSITQQNNDSYTPNQSANLSTDNKDAALEESTLDNQQNLPEYRLKQTKQYQQLDAEIDKDAEQLSKLIDEVKKRNQQQIKQQQVDAPKAKNTAVAPPTNSVVHDYPITPITPLSE